jgi:cyclase
MFLPRVLPCLLLRNLGLVKTVKFGKSRYIGDPMNAVRIFNAKEADELIFLDIDATKEHRMISLPFVEKIADEAFMPFAIGGGIKSIKEIREVFAVGAEKVVINSSAVLNPTLVQEAADTFGSQSIVVSIDAKRKFFGKYEACICGGTKGSGMDPVTLAKLMEDKGAGEIMINSIDRDGTMEGFDMHLLSAIADAVRVPVIASGGAGSIQDLALGVVQGGVSAVAAGSLFVYHGKRRAVLINYPTKEEWHTTFSRAADSG